jgi:hypothetical protein
MVSRAGARMVKRWVLTAAVATLLASWPVGAWADNSSGPVSASISVGTPLVRSVNVTPTSFAYGACRAVNGKSTGAQLVNPNGMCLSPWIVVVVGDVPSHVLVSTTSLAAPSSTAKPWLPCDPTLALSCTGPGALPGTDQVALRLSGRVGTAAITSQYLSTTAGCDHNAAPTCAVLPSGTRATESVTLTGPSLSTDGSPTRRHSIVWTVGP